MTSAVQHEPDHETVPVPMPAGSAAPIVPASNIAIHALFLVVAIMAFLACVTVGAVAVIAGAASEWQSEIAHEITIQIRPRDGVDTGAAAAEAVAIVSQVPGVSSARALGDAEIRNLLEPWLGAGADLDELPVPRLVVVGIDRDSPPDFGEIRRQLESAVPGASLDGHELWQGRLRVMANTLVVSGAGILVLVLAATVLSVVFATRGAMASNRDIVEVLHLVGAKEAFIVRQFERHFLRLGFKGGVAGGLLAIAAFGLVRWITDQFGATPAGDQFDALFGAVSIGWSAILGIVLTIILVAILTAVTSRLAVFHFLKVFD
jgi:cell division transport system permease protein